MNTTHERPCSTIGLKIHTPLGTYAHAFDSALTTTGVLTLTIQAMGIDTRDKLELYHNDKLLDPDMPIHDLPDWTHLDLLATGNIV